MESTKISWTGTRDPATGNWHEGCTFNPWIGCSHKIETVDGKAVQDPACINCYAEYQQDTRFGRVQWGPGKARTRTSVAYWRQPYKWEKQAIAQGFTIKVFCASLADWLDDGVQSEWFADLMQVVAATPHLTWMLLSKRPELWESRLKTAIWDLPLHPATPFMQRWLDGETPANVWAGTTVTLQALVDLRVPALLNIPAKYWFLSLEPLADGALDLSRYIGDWSCFCGWRGFEPPIDDSEEGADADEEQHYCPACGKVESEGLGLTEALPNGVGLPVLDMIIVGGESDAGSKARPFHLEWAEATLEQCVDGGVAFFMKQVGSNPYYHGAPYSMISDRKGGILTELPAHLQRQEFPDDK